MGVTARCAAPSCPRRTLGVKATGSGDDGGEGEGADDFLKELEGTANFDSGAGILKEETGAAGLGGGAPLPATDQEAEEGGGDGSDDESDGALDNVEVIHEAEWPDDLKDILVTSALEVKTPKGKSRKFKVCATRGSWAGAFNRASLFALTKKPPRCPQVVMGRGFLRLGTDEYFFNKGNATLNWT